jgi:hypothetical protein
VRSRVVGEVQAATGARLRPRAAPWAKRTGPLPVDRLCHRRDSRGGGASATATAATPLAAVVVGLNLPLGRILVSRRKWRRAGTPRPRRRTAGPDRQALAQVADLRLGLRRRLRSRPQSRSRHPRWPPARAAPSKLVDIARGWVLLNTASTSGIRSQRRRMAVASAQPQPP